MLSGARLLIVEEEFLIALDIQRVIEGANARQTVFARNYEEVAALGAALSQFDLAIVTPPRPGTDDLSVADRLASAGPAIVVCSATRNAIAGTALENAEFIDKPFADELLLAACGRALDKKRGR